MCPILTKVIITCRCFNGKSGDQMEIRNTWLLKCFSIGLSILVLSSTSNTDARYIRFSMRHCFSLAQILIIPLLIHLNCSHSDRTSWHRVCVQWSSPIAEVLSVCKDSTILLSRPTQSYFLSCLVRAPTITGLFQCCSERLPSSPWGIGRIDEIPIPTFAFEFYLDLPNGTPPRPAIWCPSSRSCFDALVSLTLILAGMMHLRSGSETALMVEKEVWKVAESLFYLKKWHESCEIREAQAIRHEDVSLLFADIVGLLHWLHRCWQKTWLRCLLRSSSDSMSWSRAVVWRRLKPLAMLIWWLEAFLTMCQIMHIVSPDVRSVCLTLWRNTVPKLGIPYRLELAYTKGQWWLVSLVQPSLRMIWGETVNLASRLEASGESDVFMCQMNLFGWKVMEFKERGEIPLKGVV